MKKRLTPRMVQDIIRRYPNEPTVNIANDFGVSIYTVYQTAKRYQVKKSEAFLSSPVSGRIQKGRSLSPSTQFKKGFPGATKGLRIEAIIKNEEKLRNWM